MIRFASALVGAALSLCWLTVAQAQSNFPSPGGANVPGAVGMGLNGSNQAVPFSAVNPLQITGPVSITSDVAVAPVPTSQTATSACQVLKATPGSLISITASIGATTVYLMLFDAASVPGDGAGQTLRWPAIRIVSDATSGWFSAQFPTPLSFATGITACLSSTGPFTKTASNTGTISGQVQ